MAPQSASHRGKQACCKFSYTGKAHRTWLRCSAEKKVPWLTPSQGTQNEHHCDASDPTANPIQIRNSGFHHRSPQHLDPRPPLKRSDARIAQHQAMSERTHSAGPRSKETVSYQKVHCNGHRARTAYARARCRRIQLPRGMHRSKTPQVPSASKRQILVRCGEASSAPLQCRHAPARQ